MSPRSRTFSDSKYTMHIGTTSVPGCNRKPGMDESIQEPKDTDRFDPIPIGPEEGVLPVTKPFTSKCDSWNQADRAQTFKNW